MNITEAMRARHSVRQYQDSALAQSACARLQAEIDACNRESGLHIQLIVDEPKAFDGFMAHYGKFSGVRNYIAMIGKKGADLDELCGYYGERLVLLAQQLGLTAESMRFETLGRFGGLPEPFTVHKGEALFPRIDAEKALAELNAIQEAQRKAALPALELEPYTQENVDFDTFCKSDFRAVKIKNCEAVKKSDKLLKFTLDDGSGTDRTIVSGIRHYYQPEQLIGKTAVAVLNLPPRKMMGIPSCGMLISAVHQEHGEEKLHLMLIDDSVPAGAKLC